jgi:hypothetical protein
MLDEYDVEFKAKAGDQGDDGRAQRGMSASDIRGREGSRGAVAGPCVVAKHKKGK